MSNNGRKEDVQSSSRNLTVTSRSSTTVKNIQLISLALEKSAEAGVQQHKIWMDDMISRKQPFKSNQVKEFYMLNLKKIISAFDSTYQSIHQIGGSRLKQMIDTAKSDMTSKIENKLEVLLTKYNNSIEAVSKQIQDMTIATETNYENKLENLKLEEMTLEEVKLEGEKLKAESVSNFELLVKHLNLNKDYMKKELISKLNEKFQDFVEEAESKLRKNSLNTLRSSTNPTEDIQKQEFNSSELKPRKDPVEQMLLTQQKIFQEQNEKIHLVQERLKHMESVELGNKHLLQETAAHLQRFEKTVNSSVTAIKSSLAEIQAKAIVAEKSTAQNFESIQGILQQILAASQFKIPSDPYMSSNETKSNSLQMSQKSIKAEDHKLTVWESRFGSNGTQSGLNDRVSSSDPAVAIGNGLKTDKEGPPKKEFPDSTFSTTSISKSFKQKMDEKEYIKSRTYPGSAKTVTAQEEHTSPRRTDEMSTQLRAEQFERSPSSWSGMNLNDALETNKSPRTTNLSGRNIALTHNQSVEIAGRTTEPQMGQMDSTYSKSTQSGPQTKILMEQIAPNSTDLAVSTSSLKKTSVVTPISTG